MKRIEEINVLSQIHKKITKREKKLLYFDIDIFLTYDKDLLKINRYLKKTNDIEFIITWIKDGFLYSSKFCKLFNAYYNCQDDTHTINFTLNYIFEIQPRILNILKYITRNCELCHMREKDTPFNILSLESDRDEFYRNVEGVKILNCDDIILKRSKIYEYTPAPQLLIQWTLKRLIHVFISNTLKETYYHFYRFMIQYEINLPYSDIIPIIYNNMIDYFNILLL